MTTTQTNSASYVECRVCGAKVANIETHLRACHSEMTLEDYTKSYPDAPLMSENARAMLENVMNLKRKKEAVIQKSQKARVVEQVESIKHKLPMHIVFDLPAESCVSASKKPILITRLPDPENIIEDEELTRNAFWDVDISQTKSLIPEIDLNYVFNPEELKDQLMALELNIPCLVWGHKGTGKTEGIEQICARTNRAFMRVQHTTNTEECHIVGQWVVKNGSTEYQLGALPLAMLNGWVYCADEYDFATPHVLSVYQSVLEGKALVIKDAPEELRIIKPHPNFRFFATGNTNGTGDETGLYAGTLTQNSANYDRFGMVVQKNYLPAAVEAQILMKRCGLRQNEASKIIEFANEIRNSFNDGKISDTISPRTLISGTRIGILKGNFAAGLRCSFINKLSALDAIVADELAQRIFG